MIQRQYRQLGSPFKYLGSPSSQTKDALNLAKEAAEGLLAVADFVPGQSEANKKYAEDYRKEYNEEYDGLSAWTYDGLNILAAPSRRPARIAPRSGTPSWPPRVTRACSAPSPSPPTVTA